MTAAGGETSVPRSYRFAEWATVRRVGGWSLAAAASIGICVAGYYTGSWASAGRAMTEQELLSEMSFGLLESADAGLDLLAAAAGEVVQ